MTPFLGLLGSLIQKSINKNPGVLPTTAGLLPINVLINPFLVVVFSHSSGLQQFQLARVDTVGRVGTLPCQDEVAQEYGLPLPGDRWAVQMRACDSEAPMGAG